MQKKLEELLDMGFNFELSLDETTFEIKKIKNGYTLTINFRKTFYFKKSDEIADFIIQSWGKEFG